MFTSLSFVVNAAGRKRRSPRVLGDDLHAKVPRLARAFDRRARRPLEEAEAHYRRRLESAKKDNKAMEPRMRDFWHEELRARILQDPRLRRDLSAALQKPPAPANKKDTLNKKFKKVRELIAQMDRDEGRPSKEHLIEAITKIIDENPRLFQSYGNRLWHGTSARLAAAVVNQYISEQQGLAKDFEYLKPERETIRKARRAFYRKRDEYRKNPQIRKLLETIDRALQLRKENPEQREFRDIISVIQEQRGTSLQRGSYYAGPRKGKPLDSKFYSHYQERLPTDFFRDVFVPLFEKMPRKFHELQREQFFVKLERRAIRYYGRRSSPKSQAEALVAIQKLHELLS